ncbi:MAG TPA: IS630 family transposase [Urbifossiella sp.]|nr:IS630 family transposase [Urbifossiella sp.]
MPRLKLLTVTDDERAELEAWVRRPKTAQRLALRSRIVLAAAAGQSNTAIAADLRVTLPTVGKWRQRFLDKRLDGLTDEPRPGPPRTITDAHIEDVVTRTLETKPANATHWSTRGLARATGLSQTAISRIWRAFGLQPHRADTFELSTDPYFVEKVRDEVGLYLDPPDRAVVLSADEKSGTPALNRTQPVLPMTPGQVERGTHDDVRNGTTSRFAALNVAIGTVIGRCHRRHRHQEFVSFLDEIDAAVPAEDGVTVHLVMGNDATHKTPAVKRWLAEHPRFVVHVTPTSASWLHQVERFFAEITEKRIRSGVFKTVKALEQAIEAHLAEHNANPKPFKWTATADLILRRVEGLQTNS